MNYELISEEEYANLSSDNERCFVEFESICRRNMTRMIDTETSNDFDQAVRQQYMAAVSAVASECNIPNIVFEIDNERTFFNSFNKFSLIVQGEVARIRIRQRGESHPYSVLLTSNARSKIEHHISRIQRLVNDSEMDADRKARLCKKLEELTEELRAQRLNFAKTMTILLAVTTGTAGIVTIAAEGRNAVNSIISIMQLIGQDKDSEDAATKRLAPPQKALPRPERTSEAYSTPVAKLRIEDDIPF